MTSVLVIRQHFGSVGHGSSARGEELAKRLAAEGHRVHVLAGNAGTDDLSGLPSMTVQRLGVRYSIDMPFWRRKLSFVEFVVRSIAHVIAHRYDVVFASSTPLPVFAPAVLAGKARRRTRVVLEVRDLWPDIPVEIGALEGRIERALAFWLERFSYRSADRVIALSSGMADVVATKTATPVTVVTNGSSAADLRPDPVSVESLRQRVGISAAQPVILYAGTLGLINDIEYLAATCRAATDAATEALVIIVGDGPEAAKLATLVDGHPRIKVLPRVSRADVTAFFALASVSLVTFRDVRLMDTNSANKFFDSLAAGLPVAINYRGWQADVLDEFDAGIVLDRDPSMAGEALAELLRSADRLERMSAGARTASERFEWSTLYPVWRDAVLGTHADG